MEAAVRNWRIMTIQILAAMGTTVWDKKVEKMHKIGEDCPQTTIQNVIRNINEESQFACNSQSLDVDITGITGTHEVGGTQEVDITGLQSQKNDDGTQAQSKDKGIYEGKEQGKEDNKEGDEKEEDKENPPPTDGEDPKGKQLRKDDHQDDKGSSGANKGADANNNDEKQGATSAGDDSTADIQVKGQYLIIHKGQ
ncbi:hypothetical protein C2845_PM03G22200 [Panicum miliaceum]|uniref:Uncharacterized protein n=1 Tax=Panicum miliaceum TaxID=4540 RepID=A0A3L6TE45_PANMI|nr:hypothetical protein C2845_PM03G22200 [Panicum miliaceum]